MELERHQKRNSSLFLSAIRLQDDDEVRQHIRAMLQPIYHHATKTTLDPNWQPLMPLDDVFETLVSDAGGQFIFVEGIQIYLGRKRVSRLYNQLERLHDDGQLQAKAFSLVDGRYDSLTATAAAHLTHEQKVLRDKIFIIFFISSSTAFTQSAAFGTLHLPKFAVLEQYHSVLYVPESNTHSLSFDTYTFQGFLSSEHRGGKGAAHYISISLYSIDAFERSLYLVGHTGLHKTANASAYLFSLWLTLKPQIDPSFIRTRWRSRRRILHALNELDFSAWVRQ
ncbi:hypothetical protein AX16_004136 [Volvariella volvacea WC 439]|nr:hypothetical protein AX16_004136 [Volvariella volvacea WC 439]